jgi:hypothetical protein
MSSESSKIFPDEAMPTRRPILVEVFFDLFDNVVTLERRNKKGRKKRGHITKKRGWNRNFTRENNITLHHRL